MRLKKPRILHILDWVDGIIIDPIQHIKSDVAMVQVLEVGARSD
jgi:hypothetical protein